MIEPLSIIKILFHLDSLALKIDFLIYQSNKDKIYTFNIDTGASSSVFMMTVMALARTLEPQ